MLRIEASILSFEKIARFKTEPERIEKACDQLF
jgi:hypothetical protein